MATYTKRTCTSCGLRDIQPKMVHMEMQYKSGSSEAGLSKRAIAGQFLGSKSSQRQVTNWFTGNTKRQYYRTKKVWMCNSCARTASGKLKNRFLDFLANVAMTIVGIFVIILFLG